MLKRLVIAAVCCLLPQCAVRAQDTTRTRVLSIQPISLVLTIVSGEYEQKLGAASSWGIGANYWDAGPIGGSGKYASGEFKLRYYPDGTALRGFSVGASAGYVHLSGGNGDTSHRAALVGPSLGVLLEYQWLLGKTKSFVVALGVGAKAILVNQDKNASGDYTLRYPTTRISIGHAF
jgi:hypothetical protein